MNGADRMRQAVLIFGILISTATGIACDEGGGPTSPTPQFPQVAGIYRGPATILSSVMGSLTGYSEMVVVQAGSELTITGSLTIGRDTVPLVAMTGTINRTGFFTLHAGGPTTSIDGQIDPECGRWNITSSSLAFVGRTLQAVVTATTTYCGILNISGTLTR